MANKRAPLALVAILVMLAIGGGGALWWVASTGDVAPEPPPGPDTVARPGAPQPRVRESVDAAAEREPDAQIVVPSSPAPWVVRGVVVSARDEPAADASVWLSMIGEAEALCRTTTEASGVYELSWIGDDVDGVRPASMIAARGSVGRTAAWPAEVQWDLKTRTAFALLRLEPTSVVRGRAIDVVGNPVANAYVEGIWMQDAAPPPWLRGAVGNELVTTRADDDGRFELSSRPGRLRLWARSERDGFGRVVEAAIGSAEAVDVGDVRVGTERVRFVLRIRDPSGAPVAIPQLRVQATVRLSDAATTRDTIVHQVGSDGELRFSVGCDAEPLFAGVTAPGHAAVDLVLARGTSGEQEYDVELERLLERRVRVVDATGREAPPGLAIDVTLREASADGRRRASPPVRRIVLGSVDPARRYDGAMTPGTVLSRLASDAGVERVGASSTFTVRARSPGVHRVWVSAPLGLAASFDVEFPEVGGAEPVEIRLPAGRAVRFVARDRTPDGAPGADAWRRRYRVWGGTLESPSVAQILGERPVRERGARQARSPSLPSMRVFPRTADSVAEHLVWLSWTASHLVVSRARAGSGSVGPDAVQRLPVPSVASPEVEFDVSHASMLAASSPVRVSLVIGSDTLALEGVEIVARRVAANAHPSAADTPDVARATTGDDGVARFALPSSDYEVFVATRTSPAARVRVTAADIARGQPIPLDFLRGVGD